MPKRAATPPPPDDEPRYVVVVHPYPLHANLLQHEDRRTLALWLACCTGKDVLLAMFYKPTSPGMVIIEVDRDFDRFESLLGMHAWSDFLLKPTREEEGKSSKVFWCAYNTGRLVEKNGWKRVYIEEHWFANWSPHNTKIKYPYPITTYCDQPPEAKTGMPLCRPLPQASFPRPAPQTKPPVGSLEWISARGSDVASDITPSSRRKRDQKLPPAAPCLKPPSIAPIGSTSTSRAPILIGTPTYPARRSAPVPPGLTRPPGLTSKQFYRHVDWGDEAECLEADQDGVPTLSSATGVSTSLGPDRYNAPPRHVPDPEGPVEADRTYHYYDEDIPKRTTKDAMTDLFDSAPRSSARWGDEEEDEDEDVPAAYPTRDQPHNYGEAVGDLNPWIEYKTPKWERPTKINIVGNEEWECPDHGSMCTPGICKERARFERERRWAKEREEREDKKRKRLEKKANEVKKKERRLARDEALEVPLDQRSNGRSRASSDSTSNGSSSGSASESEEDSSHDRGERVHVESPERSLPPASPSPEDRNVTDTDEDEEGDMRSVTGAWTTSTSGNSQTDMSEISRSSASNRPSPRNARGIASSRSQRSTRSLSAQSPALGQRQPAWDARSTASSRTTASSTRNEQPTRGNATTKPKSLSGQCPPDWDTRSSASVHTTSSARSEQSSVSSAAGSRRPVSGTRNPVGAHNTASPVPDTPAEGGFPTYSNTEWGNTIAYRLAHPRKSSADTGVGDAEEDGVGDTVEAGKQGSERSSSGSGRRSGRGRWAKRKVDPEARKGVGSSQATLSSILNVKLPPGGPGEPWGDPEVVW